MTILNSKKNYWMELSKLKLIMRRNKKIQSIKFFQNYKTIFKTSGKIFYSQKIIYMISNKVKS
jgi:hypothetical protein